MNRIPDIRVNLVSNFQGVETGMDSPEVLPELLGLDLTAELNLHFRGLSVPVGNEASTRYQMQAVVDQFLHAKADTEKLWFDRIRNCWRYLL